MSCLFNSLSHFIQENSFMIRQKICDYLESNHAIMDGLETKFILELDSKNYINQMRSTSTWGGAIEIQAACNIYSARIIVHNYRESWKSDKKIEFLPLHKNYEKTFEIYWTGGHYEPIII